VKRLLIAALVVTLGLLVLSTERMNIPSAYAAGAVQSFLDSSWSATDGALAQPLGKVVYNVPDKRNKMPVTYILQGANPNTNYTVGFNIHSESVDCSGTPPVFGVPRSLCPSGTVGGIFDTEALYQVGTLSTDTEGDGSLHINLLGLPSGTYNVLFWVVPCTPPGACGFYPQGATGS